MSNVTLLPLNKVSASQCTGSGLAVDAFMAVRSEGQPLEKVAADYADSLMDSLSDSTKPEQRALLEGFIFRLLELAA